MASIQNLDDRTPIVSLGDGSPTHYFMGLLQRRGGLLQSAQDAIDSLLAMEFIAGIGLDGGGVVQDAVDADALAPTITFDLADTAVAAGAYGDATHVGQFTVDAQGRLTSASNVAITATATVADGDKGDITVSGTGTVWTIDTGVVTLAKIAVASASSKLLGSGASGSGSSYSEITLGSGLTMTGTTLSASGGSGATPTLNEIPSGTINGSNVTFTLAATPSAAGIALYQNGLRLKLTTDYSLSTATITMVAAPLTGDTLFADYFT